MIVYLLISVIFLWFIGQVHTCIYVNVGNLPFTNTIGTYTDLLFLLLMSIQKCPQSVKLPYFIFFILFLFMSLIYLNFFIGLIDLILE
jgi:hypothetical protein